jgi:methylmalonyl-CoA/ethylmalonyl-CoA epimerase
MHHLCFEVDDILAARDQLVSAGARVLGDGAPKIGAHGKPVLFLHPKDFNGTLIELEQVLGAPDVWQHAETIEISVEFCYFG